MAAALDAAHAAGLVHRDVKPQNILVDAMPERAEHAYLSDFGLSKATASTGLTASGEFLGTPDYCAPEQVKSARVDGRADQYALACVAFTLLTGTAPFRREEPLGTLFAHVQDPVPPVTGLRQELPSAVDGVIARALAKSPDDRYARCGEFAAALREVLVPDHPATIAGRPATAGTPAPVTPAPASAGIGYADTITARSGGAGHAEGTPRQDGGRGRKRGRTRATWAAGAAAVVLAAGMLAVVLLHHSPPASPGQAGQGPSHAATSTGNVVASRVLAGSGYGFGNPVGIASDGTHIWVANGTADSVTELNAGSGSVIRVLKGARYGFNVPNALAFDGTHIWVASNGGHSVMELNAGDGRLIRTLKGPGYGISDPWDIAAVGTHIWITNPLGGSVTELTIG